ncbi:MAG: hypothetical protein DIKNOCCD_00646 [bacterium]|nr:hypothetical protein [bacterium]
MPDNFSMSQVSRIALRKTSIPTLLQDVENVLELAEILPLLRSGQLILIKPNLVTDIQDYIDRGANTSLDILDALLQILSDFHAKVEIVESETGTSAKGRRLAYAWQRMGLEPLAVHYQARLVNLSEAPRVTVPFTGKGLSGLDLPQRLFDADLILNIPKIKTHKYAVLTCSMKNLFGLVPEPRRIIYHRWLHQTLCDLALLLQPRMVTLVDGLTGMEGNGPLYGTPVEMNLLVAGKNCVAVDRTVCEIIGVSPHQVPYLRLAEKEPSLSVGNIELAGDPIEHCLRPFKPVEFNLYRLFEKKLMETPLVHVITSGWFQRHVSSHLAGLTHRLRGGGYSWYLEESPNGTPSRQEENKI